VRQLSFQLDLSSIDVEKKAYDLGEWAVQFTQRPLWHITKDGTKTRCRGTTNFETETITIDGTLVKDIQRSTFLHEMIHILDNFKEIVDKDGECYQALDAEEYTLLREYVISIALEHFEWMLKQRAKRR
jgi:hypothetical protein